MLESGGLQGIFHSSAGADGTVNRKVAGAQLKETSETVILHLGRTSLNDLPAPGCDDRPFTAKLT